MTVTPIDRDNPDDDWYYDRNDDDGYDPDDDWYDDRDDYREPDPEDYEIARAYGEHAEHCEKVHGGGDCDCRPSVFRRLAWRVQRAAGRLVTAWWRARYAVDNPWTLRAGPAEITIRLNRHRSCACGGRGWFYHKTGIDPMPMPEGYDGVSLCPCGSVIGQLADSRRVVRKTARHDRNEPPF